MQIDAKVVNVETQLAKLTTNWQQFRWHTDGILIAVEKFRVRTHHNALRFISVSHSGARSGSPQLRFRVLIDRWYNEGDYILN